MNIEPMRPLILKCPSCNGELAVGRLACHSCDICIEGDFGLPALLRLNRGQLDFVEVFLKNRGIIREVEREIGVSYPTVRARLDEVIEAIGLNLASAPMPASEDHRHEDHRSDDARDRRGVLEELRSGKITPEQALKALSPSTATAKPNRNQEKSPREESEEDPQED